MQPMCTLLAICTTSRSSPFTKASPPVSFRYSKSSPLACATPSNEPNPSRCAFPMPVISPWVGLAIWQSSRISPGWLAPSSSTAISIPGCKPSNDSGTPRSLFRFPSVPPTFSSVARADIISRRVVVFPLLPVIATMGIRSVSRCSNATCCRASLTFGTTTIPSTPSSSVRSTTASLAPAAKAALA